MIVTHRRLTYRLDRPASSSRLPSILRQKHIYGLDGPDVPMDLGNLFVGPGLSFFNLLRRTSYCLLWPGGAFKTQLGPPVPFSRLFSVEGSRTRIAYTEKVGTLILTNLYWSKSSSLWGSAHCRFRPEVARLLVAPLAAFSRPSLPASHRDRPGARASDGVSMPFKSGSMTPGGCVAFLRVAPCRCFFLFGNRSSKPEIHFVGSAPEKDGPM